MSIETNETNMAAGRTVKRDEFNGGKHFCLESGEIKAGGRYTERRRFSSHLRDFLGDNSGIMDDDVMFAKDTSVVITRRAGNRVEVADLIAVGDDDFVEGETTRWHALAAEGWIVPQGLTVEEAQGLSAGNNAAVEGYYMPFIDPRAEELEEAEVPAYIRKAQNQAAGSLALNDGEQPPVYYGREY